MRDKHLLIATPTVHSAVTTAYASTLVEVTQACHDLGWRWSYQFVDGADVAMARNILANQALTTEGCTHILFVDSDMAIPRHAIDRMLLLDVPIVGVLYTARSLDLDAYAVARARGLPDPQARAVASRFHLRASGEALEIVDGLCEVEGFGFGGVLINVELLRRLTSSPLVAHVRDARLVKHNVPESWYDFFSEIQISDGTWFSEDFSFCYRVRQLGERIVALADADIGHVGVFRYGGSFSNWVRGQRALRP